jgi:hypothetical protein
MSIQIDVFWITEEIKIQGDKAMCWFANLLNSKLKQDRAMAK